MLVKILSSLFLLATLIPLVIMFTRTLKTLRAPATCFLAFIIAAVIFMRPHQDTYSGLDNMAYPHLAELFADGHPLRGIDENFALVPKEIRPALLYRDKKGARFTHDLTFQIDTNLAKYTSFFFPVLPLAAAASGVGRYFTPILAIIWFIFIVRSAIHKNGRAAGLIFALALLLASAWPAWFMRGFYPEAVGTILISAVIASAAMTPLRSAGDFFTAAFLVAFAAAYHPTVMLLSAPVFITVIIPQLAAERGRRTRLFVAIALGVLLGLVPLYALTRWICHPYGDWTRLTTLVHLLNSATEHAALFTAMTLMLLAAATAMTIAFTARGRRLAAVLDRKLTPLGYPLLALIPYASLCLAPTGIRDSFNRGLFSTLSSLPINATLIFIVSAAGIFTSRLRKNSPERLSLSALLVALSYAAVPFFLIKGVETEAGLWSLRRFLPVIILFLTVVAQISLTTSTSSRIRLAAAIGAFALAAISPLRFPAPYTVVDERESPVLMSETKEAIRQLSPCLVIFDYFPHSVPYASEKEAKVFGLGEHAQARWPQVANWMEDVATTGNVACVTSYKVAAPILEEGFALIPDPKRKYRATIKKLRGNNFKTACIVEREITHDFLRVVSPSQLTSQHLEMTGSPLGIRGDWTPVKNGERWSRQNSGFIGPIPTNAPVLLQITARFYPPTASLTNQTLSLAPPWDTPPISLSFGEAKTTLSVQIDPPPARTTATGVYRIFSPTPYNPAKYGVKGYPDDLGVCVSSITIVPQEVTRYVAGSNSTDLAKIAR